MSLGLDFDPASGINTGIDVFARAVTMSTMPGTRILKSKEVPVQFSFSSLRRESLPKENHRYGDEQTSGTGSGAQCSEL
jgi:hypothetical protein